MHSSPPSGPLIAIACGGTGGHLYPGLAVAQELISLGCSVVLLISPKEVDQQAVTSAQGMQVVTLPAVGLTRGGVVSFARGFWKSLQATNTLFRKNPPQAVLAMGGFTSAPPILAGRSVGAKTFFHEANTIPGRANRWLAHLVDEGFVFFHDTSGRVAIPHVRTTGMPVRPQFMEGLEAASARMALGLQPQKPVLLVMGGSQGARSINQLVVQALPILARDQPDLQFIHLTGPQDVESVQGAYAQAQRKALVRPFLTEMELALGAATLAVSRSGASSLAEFAALQLPPILIPYPTAADNHQYFNALAFAESGAAILREQHATTSEQLARDINALLNIPEERAAMQKALGQWHQPQAARQIAERMLQVMDPSGALLAKLQAAESDSQPGGLWKELPE